MEYIKAGTALHKIRQAYRNGTPLYISGSAGMGKTAAVRYFLRKQKYTRISGLTSELDHEPSAEELSGQTLVIDDLSNVTDLTSREYVQAILRAGTIPVILIGRSMLPGWLSAVSAEVGMEVVIGRDLVLSDEGVHVLFAERGVDLTSEQIGQVRADCWNNTWLMILAAQSAGAKGQYTKETLSSARISFYGYLDQRFYEQLDPGQRRLLTTVAPFGNFSVRFVQMLAADRRAPAMLEKMSHTGDFLAVYDGNQYRITEPYCAYLCWKRKDQYSESEQREGNERAALYFELLDQPERALECYREIGDTQRMIRLLVRLIRESPGIETNLPVLYRYLHALSEAAINAQPVLMYGMSMVNSQIYHRDLSEEWYRKLSKFRDSAARGSTSRNEADHLLVLLDLLLPHRSSSGLAATLLRASAMPGDWATYIDGVVLTDGSASLLDGVHDMCEAVNQHQTIMSQNMLSEALQKILGKKAQPYLKLFRMERLLEEGNAGEAEFSDKVNQVYMEGEAQGEQEICDVATMLLIRHYVYEGRLSTSENLLESYMRRNARRQSGRKDSGIRRMQIEIQMLRGDTQSARDWMRTGPDPAEFFVFGQRYRYFLEIKILMLLGREDEALILDQRLEIVLKDYRREYLLMRVRILKAIILFRKEDRTWEEVLAQALSEAQKYHLCESVSVEGAALYPLLQKFCADRKNRADTDRVSDDYLEKIRIRTQQMAMYYPNYLHPYTQIDEKLTQMELKVVRLLASNLSSEEICELLHITYNGLKFHRRNIYRKLGVKNRGEAVMKAKALGLCNS